MRAAIVTVALFALTTAASAQENLLPSTAWGFATTASGWHFAKPLATSSGSIADVAQAAVPLQMRAMLGRWSFDLTGAYAVAAIHTKRAIAGDTLEDVTLLQGPTDVKLRMNGPLFSDNIVVTAGVNLPSGTTRLDGDQTAVLQSVGAPALNMPVSAYGIGPGGTLGLIGVVETGGWALALGGSVEKRAEYTPIALAISSTKSETRLTPGTAAHVSFGADRVLGSTRLSVLLLGDAYSADKVAIFDGSAETGRSQYQLGPQAAALTRLDFGGGVWSEGALALSARYRSEFRDAGGEPVTGSSGKYLEGSLGGVLGGTHGAGLVIGVDGRWHSGMPFTTALVGTAVTAGGATLGIQFPAGFRFTVRGQYGTFDTGVTQTTGFGGSVGLSIFARRDAR